MATREQQAAALQADWDANPRWRGIVRHYSAADVVRLRGSLALEHTLARRGADSLWHLLNAQPFVAALGAMTGNDAMQQVKAGLKAVYLSASPVPLLVRRVNHALQRADQVQWSEGKDEIDYAAPIVAAADAGSGGVLGAFELMQSMIEAGAAGVHFDDRLAPAGQCGPTGGSVLVPTREAIARLTAARLAADVMGTATVLIARTDAEAADMLTSDADAGDQPFCTGQRTPQGWCKVRPGLEHAVARALAYAPFADLLWCDTGKPDLVFASRFADAVHARYPGKLLAYHCSPAFNWKEHLDDGTIARFQKELGAMGYQFQFIALAGCHAVNDGMYRLAHGYARRQMTAFVELQEAGLVAAGEAVSPGGHQRDTGAGYVDAVTRTILQHQRSSTTLQVAYQCGGVAAGGELSVAGRSGG